MFTGIINSIGNIESRSIDEIQISTDNDLYHGLEPGTSISIDGTCLTLRDYKDDFLNFQVSEETFSRTVAKEYEKDLGSEGCRRYAQSLQCTPCCMCHIHVCHTYMCALHRLAPTTPEE